MSWFWNASGYLPIRQFRVSSYPGCMFIFQVWQVYFSVSPLSYPVLGYLWVWFIGWKETPLTGHQSRSYSHTLGNVYSTYLGEKTWEPKYPHTTLSLVWSDSASYCTTVPWLNDLNLIIWLRPSWHEMCIVITVVCNDDKRWAFL